MENDNKDVHLEDDAILYLQNMIAAENHAIESWNSTKKEKYLKIAKQLRKNRSKMLYRLVPENDAEDYCLSKHLLVSAMAIKELGNRFTEDNDEKLAKECFEEARLYENLFKFLIGGKK